MTPRGFSEQHLVEKPTLELLSTLGYDVIDAYTEEFGAEAVAAGNPGRDDRSQVILHHRLRPKLAELNPDLPGRALDSAVEQLQQDRSALDPVRANQALWKLLRNGVKVEYLSDDEERESATVRVIDWTAPATNDFLAVSQLWIVGPLHTRRTDIVCFVNGIPLVLLELKASHKSVKEAYDKNLTDYRDT
ncbi:MAG TPA: type I restriction endonuclease, partial [Baekduia sp.]|nr:type I restriction endonuclease [Baekduia sp.]